MTDNEIIKALKCCTVGTFACGKECPYYSSKSNLKVSSCRFELMCEISDLINRQNNMIEAFNLRLKHEKAHKEKLAEQSKRQKDEIDRLQKTVVDLNANLSESINRFTLMETLYKIKIKCKELEIIKSEAIKAFKERLK